MMYDLHMAINKGKVCIMYYIFFVEFLGHNFVSGLRTLISKNLKKLVFFSSAVMVIGLLIIHVISI